MIYKAPKSQKKSERIMHKLLGYYSYKNSWKCSI